MRFPSHRPSHSQRDSSLAMAVKDLSVTLEEDVILKNLNFHLHAGEIVALIGPNGAGKTSLFNSILGRIPYKGEISFHGKKTSGPRIGYVPQSPTFDSGDPISVLDFFSSGISNYPIFLPCPPSLRKRVKECLRRVSGESLIDKRLGHLSGGELQRVLLAMALEPLPQILILDEPLSGVDVEGEHQLLTMLSEIRHRYELAILYSTHDFATLETYADRAILLKQEIIKIGTAKEVLHSSEFRKTFHLEKEHKGGWML